MPTFVHAPEHHSPNPVIVYLMDAPGIRDALQKMARRLASAGYYVMLPYLYYRAEPYREFTTSDADMHRRQELMGTITPSNILGDFQALVSFANTDERADANKVGVVGFCMSGGLALSCARGFPDLVKAAASIHGAWLVRDTADSPHLGLSSATAELYFGWADNDPTAPLPDLDTMRSSLDAAGLEYTIDFFDDALHGFAPEGTPRYDQYASEVHWERVHELMRRRLL